LSILLFWKARHASRAATKPTPHWERTNSECRSSRLLNPSSLRNRKRRALPVCRLNPRMGLPSRNLPLSRQRIGRLRGLRTLQALSFPG
jgi:hypothetical protein